MFKFSNLPLENVFLAASWGELLVLRIKSVSRETRIWHLQVYKSITISSQQRRLTYIARHGGNKENQLSLSTKAKGKGEKETENGSRKLGKPRQQKATLSNCKFNNFKWRRGVCLLLPIDFNPASEVRRSAVPSKPKVGVAQRRLQLMSTKTPRQLKVRRPLPQASKTNLYDEHWAAKQERGLQMPLFRSSHAHCTMYLVCSMLHFSYCVYLLNWTSSLLTAFVKWLNHILAPVDDLGHVLPTTQGQNGEQDIESSCHLLVGSHCILRDITILSLTCTQLPSPRPVWILVTAAWPEVNMVVLLPRHTMSSPSVATASCPDSGGLPSSSINPSHSASSSPD